MTHIVTTPDQIKAIKADFKLFWGEAPEGTLKYQKGEDTFNYFRHSLASLLTAEIGVLEGRLGSWPCPHCGGSEAVIPEVIERYRDLIKSLE